MWVEKTLGLYQHKDGVELPAPQGQDPVQYHCLVTWHASEAPAS